MQSVNVHSFANVKESGQKRRLLPPEKRKPRESWCVILISGHTLPPPNHNTMAQNMITVIIRTVKPLFLEAGTEWP